jgi:NIMA (never in mitosis gene a)-related kinase
MNVSKIAENGLLYTQTGTPYYASPEVWNEQPYDSKSDIWSLGCVIYEMTTLEVPFKAEDMEGLAQTVLIGKFSPIPNSFSKELSQLINNMLQLKPKNRPTCDKILRYPVMLRKIGELNLDEVGVDSRQRELLSTIKMPRKLQYLTDKLPKANYSFSQSHDPSKLESSLHKLKKEERERERTSKLSTT